MSDTERSDEIRRVVEQLESFAEDCLAVAQKNASRLRSVADALARREAARVEAEKRFRPGGMFGGHQS